MPENNRIKSNRNAKLNIRIRAKNLKRDIVALWLAARDRRVPAAAKVIAGATAAYALSPIDLIPDFIPVFGYLDDLIIVPVGIWLALRMIPAPLMAEFRLAAALISKRPISRLAALVILLIWIAVSLLVAQRLWV